MNLPHRAPREDLPTVAANVADLGAADVDDVMEAAWSRVEKMRGALPADAQPALDAGVPTQAHPGKVEILCTVLAQYEQQVITALLRGLRDSGYFGVARAVPESPGGGSPFVMRSILVSGPPVDDIVVAAAGRGSEPPAQVRSNIEDVDLAARHAGLALIGFQIGHRTELMQMTEADREAVTLRFVLMFLVSQGLIVVSPEGAFERMIPLDLEGPYADNLAEHIAQARLTPFTRMARNR